MCVLLAKASFSLFTNHGVKTPCYFLMTQDDWSDGGMNHLTGLREPQNPNAVTQTEKDLTGNTNKNTIRVLQASQICFLTKNPGVIVKINSEKHFKKK